MSQLVTRPSGGAVTVMEQGALVSVIVVTSNRESHLRECVSGLMQQSISNRIEVIVVDEGSQQCEWAVVADLQKAHPNLVALKLPAQSAGKGVNMAVKIASGRYLTLLEAADRLKRDAYEQLAAALDGNPAAMLAYGDTCFTAIPHESFASHTSYGKVIWPDYTPQQLAHLSEVAPHLMWRRELHDAIGLIPEGCPDHGLREFLLKVVERYRIMHVQEFTGLRLIAAGGQQPVQEAPAAEPRLAAAHPAVPSPVQREYEAPAQPEEAPVAYAQPVSTAEEPDEAYLKLRPLVTGEDKELAAIVLREHLALYPRHAVAHNDLAAVSYQLGDIEQAIKHYREAVWLEPGEAVYQKNLADLLFIEAGQTDEAIGIYLKLLEKDPRDVETLLNLGIIAEGVGQPAEAESFYQRGLEIEPWNQALRGRLTELRERVCAEAEEGCCADEEPVEDRYRKTQELVANEDFDGAERELGAILHSYPDFAPAHNDLAVLLYGRGDKEGARGHYEKAAALTPANGTFQKNLADFYFVEGVDVDGAIAIYLDQLEREPKNVETLMGLGKICTILDRPQEAESFYGKVVTLEPWNRDARECLNTLKQAANG